MTWPRCLLCLLLASSLGCQAPPLPPSTPPTPRPPTASIPSPSPPPFLPNSVARGICLAHNWQEGGAKGYGTQASEETLEWAAGLGTTHISLTPFGWMASLYDPHIKGEHIDAGHMPAGGETRARVAQVTTQAHALGLDVMLKPHLWVKGGAWRGDIAPEDWAMWWAEYGAFMLHWARVAQSLGITRLVAGVELVRALKAHPEAFLKLVASLRQVYQGQLTYSANWDEAVPDEIWQALDAIGVQFYPPLSATDPSPTHAILRQAIARHLDPWRQTSRRTGKPLWLTEVGYKSASTSVTEPFGWPERLPKHLRAQDEVIQARAYSALFEEIASAPEVKGVYIWKVFTDRKTDEEGDFGFSPRGKRAEEALRRAFKTNR